MKQLHPKAHALTVFRLLPDNEGRQYTATWFPKAPWQGCEHIIRVASKVGYVRDDGDSYAALDVLDEEGSIVQDYRIPNRRAFEWWYRKLNLRVEQ